MTHPCAWPPAPIGTAPVARTPCGRWAGFTVVELLLAVTLAGVVAAFAVPSWRALLVAAELRERAEALAAALATARSEAIKRSARVDVCAGVDPADCLTSPAWEAGWLAVVNAGIADAPSPGASILARERAARAGITIRGNGPVAQYVSYTSLGHARRHDGALQMGTFTICRSGAAALKVVLANSGRTRIDATQELCP